MTSVIRIFMTDSLSVTLLAVADATLKIAPGNFLFHDDSSTEFRWTTPQPDTAGLSMG
ncbi:hypothetical protein KCO_21217 [Pectobacterium brasiliense ICMP 19477]|nr:hypothetical protein KCO_21217 [Pectobacterium brasiliense ICMP 19477]